MPEKIPTKMVMAVQPPKALLRETNGSFNGLKNKAGYFCGGTWLEGGRLTSHKIVKAPKEEEQQFGAIPISQHAS